MTSPLTRIRWFCPNCDEDHDLTLPNGEAAKAAQELREAGALMVVLYDETYAIMLDHDAAEAYGPPPVTGPVSARAELVKTFKRLAWWRKSP